MRCGLDPIDLPGFPVESVDTTGAGDAFVAAFLAQLLERKNLPDDLDSLDGDSLAKMARLANAAGAICTMQKGAIPAMPTRSAVNRLMVEHVI